MWMVCLCRSVCAMLAAYDRFVIHLFMYLFINIVISYFKFFGITVLRFYENTPVMLSVHNSGAERLCG